MTLVSEDDSRIRAHKVVLASASTLFRDLFQNQDEDTDYLVIHMRKVSSKFIKAMVDLVYNGEAQVEERDCDEFLKILKEYKMLKVKSTKETNQMRCNFFNRGYCKAGPECMFYHPKEDCEVHKLGNICIDRSCRKRHRTVCKYWDTSSVCLRGSDCMFMHRSSTEKVFHGEAQFEDDLKQCDTCKFKKDEKQVKLHNIKDHIFMLCQKCDKNIKHKEILLTENFDMKDFLSVIFRDKSLNKIAQMVNY